MYTIENGYRKRRAFVGRIAIITVSLLAVVLGADFALNRQSGSPLQLANTTMQPATAVQQKITVPMKWPSYGHSAYAVSGSSVLATSDNEMKPVPIASLAKVITALAIVKQKPIAAGQSGPMLTLSDSDVALYQQYISKDGSVIPVEIGEQLTERQALEAMLMVSANNMADILARWAFGSDQAYVDYANQMLKELGLNQTIVADASGFSAATMSTTHDLTVLGTLYMQHPILREIAMQKQVTIPFAGPIQNYNSVINKDGFYGIKVGNTDEAGRCFIAADIRGSGANEKVSIAVVLGADHIKTAMDDAQKIINAGNSAYDEIAKTP